MMARQNADGNIYALTNEYNTSINQKEHLSNVIELLLKQEQNNNYMPYELLKKKERGRKE